MFKMPNWHPEQANILYTSLIKMKEKPMLPLFYEVLEHLYMMLFDHHLCDVLELLLYDILEFLPAIGQPIVVLGTLRYKQRTSIGVHTIEGIRLGKRRNF